MSKIIDFTFCELPDTPAKFNVSSFEAGDPEQATLYKLNKRPNMKKKLTYDEVISETKPKNYARFVPDDCMFIDFDNKAQAEEMREIIIHSKLRCLILTTQHGYHFLFRKPDFFKVQMTGATNWFGYKFDTKGPGAVQIIKVCGMEREEVCSWDLDTLVAPASIDIEKLDVLPYWLWGVLRQKDLFKKGVTKSEEYTLEDTPFTQLMKMREGGRHNHIVEHCSYFGVANGFTIDELKDLLRAIHDQFLVKLGTPMPDSDLFGDLDSRWEGYTGMLSSGGYDYDKEKRKWIPGARKEEEKLNERNAANWLFSQYDFYATDAGTDGVLKKLFYRIKEGPFEYKTDLTVPRQSLIEHSEQNFKETFFKEVEVQLMQMCAANNRRIGRNDTYIIVKNKVLSCIADMAFDFDWLASKAPTDVVLPWNYYSREWVEEHEKDLGSQINWFISQLSRDHRGIPQPVVQDWLWVIAGASMVPANQLQKIVILSGGGQNGKSLYTSLIRLCLGDTMFNESKIFDTNPQEKFWGEDFDKGILCVVDDLIRTYNRESFTALKGALTGTDSVWINEKFKPKKRLDVIPQIIACTNFEFELYDKSEGMRRRLKILPTEFHIDDKDKDGDLQHKIVLNTRSKEVVAEYRMKESSFGDKGTRVMNMYTKESGVLQSLKDGSLAWFANKARYTYLDWVAGKLILSDTDEMKDKIDSTFSGGFDSEMKEFLRWYITERGDSIWTKELFSEYQEWHNEMATGELMMNERTFARNLTKGIQAMQTEGYKALLKKQKNEKGMSLNKLLLGEDAK